MAAPNKHKERSIHRMTKAPTRVRTQNLSTENLRTEQQAVGDPMTMNQSAVKKHRRRRRRRPKRRGDFQLLRRVRKLILTKGPRILSRPAQCGQGICLVERTLSPRGMAALVKSRRDCSWQVSPLVGPKRTFSANHAARLVEMIKLIVQVL